MGNEAKPLAGRRIVITRAPEQSDELLRCLRELGAEPLLLPVVRYVAVEDSGALDSAIAWLDDFDWLIFSSANAARFFLGRCRELGRWPSEARPFIAAVGAATRSAVEAAKLRVAFVPKAFTGAALAAELSDKVAGKKLLLPRSDKAGDGLPAALRMAGAEVAEVVAYRTAETEGLDPALCAAMLRGDVDAIAFFSPSAFQHFSRALGERAVHDMSSRVAFAAVGPVTAAAIRQGGLPVAVEAVEASSAAVASALANYFAGAVVNNKGRN